jgi:hypothetical protein
MKCPDPYEGMSDEEVDGELDQVFAKHRGQDHRGADPDAEGIAGQPRPGAQPALDLAQRLIPLSVA